MSDIKLVKYIDGDLNTYRVERASNGKWVAMRHNVGGKNRKMFKCVEPSGNKDIVQDALDMIASLNLWSTVED